jgi:hypothetical protein
MKAIHLRAYGNPTQSLRWSRFRNQVPRLRVRLLCAWSMRGLTTATSSWRTEFTF